MSLSRIGSALRGHGQSCALAAQSLPPYNRTRRSPRALLRGLLALCLLPALHTVAFASTEGDAQPQFKVTLRTLALNRDAATYTYISNGEIKDFPLSYDAVCQPFSYTGPSPMLIFRGRPDIEYDLSTQAVGAITLNANTRDLILLCSTDTGSFKYLPLSADAAALPLGSFCLVNTTSTPVGGLLDQERLLVQPGHFSVITENKLGEKRVPVRMARQVNDTWEMFYSSSWSVPGNKRVFIIVYNDSDSGKTHIRGANLR